MIKILNETAKEWIIGIANLLRINSANRKIFKMTSSVD